MLKEALVDYARWMGYDHPERGDAWLQRLTMPFNLAGLPASSVPWGRSTTGVPIGLQLIGRRGADWQVLAAAARLQAVRTTR